MPRIARLLMGFGVFLTACGPAVGSFDRGGGETAAVSKPPRTLIAALRVGPSSVAARRIGPGGVAVYLSDRLFNADLAILNDDGVPEPYLAEALPRLDTDSWRVFADGRMETTYRLKPDLVWHDGAPLKSS